MGKHSLRAMCALINAALDSFFTPPKDPFSLTQSDLSPDKRPSKCSSFTPWGAAPDQGIYGGVCHFHNFFKQS